MTSNVPLGDAAEGPGAGEAGPRRNGMRAIGAMAATAVLLAIPFGGMAQAGGDVAKGKAAFQQSCGGCHGPAGKGDGAMGAALNPKPKDLSDKAYNGSMKDDYLVKLIKEGGPAVGKSPLMPKMGGTLKDGDVADVVAFIRSLAK
jgi:mono/diheme cytochrome c family protein